MWTDCPHCYTRVIPKEDGTCPACQKNTLDTTGVDPTRTSIRVREGDLLPEICCDCGMGTSRFVTVFREGATRESETSGFGKLLIGLFFSLRLGALMFAHDRDNVSSVAVEIPQCDACALNGPPEPRHVDFQNVRMTFIVHKNLRSAMSG